MIRCYHSTYATLTPETKLKRNLIRTDDDLVGAAYNSNFELLTISLVSSLVDLVDPSSSPHLYGPAPLLVPAPISTLPPLSLHFLPPEYALQRVGTRGCRWVYQQHIHPILSESDFDE